MMPLHFISRNMLEHEFEDSALWCGDCIGFEPPKLNWWQSWIQGVQLRELHNMPQFPLLPVKSYSRIVHIGTINWDSRKKEPRIAEMTFPHARNRSFGEIPTGTVLWIRRLSWPRDTELKAYQEYAAAVGLSAQIDVRHEYPYSLKELAYYLFGWGMLRSATRDVCSGRYVHWAHHQGFMLEEKPHEWYPARLMIDKKYLHDVMRIKVTD